MVTCFRATPPPKAPHRGHTRCVKRALSVPVPRVDPRARGTPTRPLRGGLPALSGLAVSWPCPAISRLEYPGHDFGLWSFGPSKGRLPCPPLTPPRPRDAGLESGKDPSGDGHRIEVYTLDRHPRLGYEFPSETETVLVARLNRGCVVSPNTKFVSQFPGKQMAWSKRRIRI
jgi:hypothetical protein